MVKDDNKKQPLQSSFLGRREFLKAGAFGLAAAATAPFLLSPGVAFAAQTMYLPYFIPEAATPKFWPRSYRASSAATLPKSGQPRRIPPITIQQRWKPAIS